MEISQRQWVVLVILVYNVGKLEYNQHGSLFKFGIVSKSHFLSARTLNSLGYFFKKRERRIQFDEYSYDVPYHP